MKILLYGKNSQSIKQLVESFGFEITSDKPDLIISYGGDGTLLASEREYPGIPKLPIRDSKVCKKCSDHDEKSLLNHLKKKTLKLQNLSKIEAQYRGRSWIALNDIVIRNSTPIHAIRFTLKINEKKFDPFLIIGDGIVVTTAFGSSGYFKSVTKQTLLEGFGIAFNNTTETIKPFEFNQKDILKIRIVRGPGVLSSDNNPDLIILEMDSEIEIRVSDKKAFIYSPDSLRCSKCVIQRHLRLD